MAKRKFLGRLDYENMNPTERGYEKAHLKAYLKGRSTFKYGRRPVYLEHPDGSKELLGTEPIWHIVKKNEE